MNESVDLAFALHRDETASAGLRRIALELIDEAQLRLARLQQPDKDIHQTRRNVKKLRAVLRLGRAGVGEIVYRRDNPYLRDFNRQLSVLRESYVRHKILRRMQRSFSQLNKADLAPLQAKLKREHQARLREFTADRRARQWVGGGLAVIANAVSAWPDFFGGKSVLGKGLEQVYTRGRAELRLARRRPRTLELHDWRKRVNYLWYQLRLLQACWPQALALHTATLSELADLLGEHHDISLFAVGVLEGDIELSHTQRKALLDGLMDRRREIAREALTMGARFYVESPGAFSRRIMGYWRQWH